MPAGLSADKTRATILLRHPAWGEETVQESKDRPSEKLRSAISKAHEAFWAEYNDPKWNDRKTEKT